MSLKASLVLMTVIAVISDSMLHPFYPQYFSAVFGVTDPQHVGLYISACALTVMVTFPLWALIARKLRVLHLLIATQVATGVLGLVCYQLDSLVAFWIVSLCMMVFKASYLLIYPYVMSLEDKRHHIGTISLLAFVVYFGNILAAISSGLVLELADPRSIFIAMASGDVLQILVCCYMLRLPAFAAEPEAEPEGPPPVPGRFVYKLGAVMFLLYFSSYLIEPYFATYWESTSALDNKLVSGVVFAIPGMAALLALYANSRARERSSPYEGILSAVGLGACGIWLQLSGVLPIMLAGRFLYGWALFQSMVRLDLLLFRVSTPESYAVDFSRVNLFQGLGVLFASAATGSLVSTSGVRLPFFAAAAGFLLVLGLYARLFRGDLRAARTTPPAAFDAAPGEGTSAP